MKKFAAVIALFVSGTVYAACYTHTYFVNGRAIVCNVCCYGNNCTTVCTK